MCNAHGKIFSREVLNKIFSKDRTNRFFAALFGDPKDGSFDIGISYLDSSENNLNFKFQLRQRTGKCLKCSLTHGLPGVFAKHPVINIEEIAKKICFTINVTLEYWELGNTIQKTENMHTIPLTVKFNGN